MDPDLMSYNELRQAIEARTVLFNERWQNLGTRDQYFIVTAQGLSPKGKKGPLITEHGPDAESVLRNVLRQLPQQELPR